MHVEAFSTLYLASKNRIPILIDHQLNSNHRKLIIVACNIFNFIHFNFLIGTCSKLDLLHTESIATIFPIYYFHVFINYV